MTRKRLFILSLLLLSGTVLIILFIQEKIKTQYNSTFAPIFQVLGITSKSFDRALTRIIPINSLAEKEFGEAIKIRYKNICNKKSLEYDYLNQLIRHLTLESRKNFKYEVYLIDNSEPNAFALPGGLILITRGLLEMVKNEGELVAILAHEIGHIELSHCFDSVRFELLAADNENYNLGQLADMILDFILRHTFSKTIENEADDFAYQLILRTDYDPASLGHSFQELIIYQEKAGYKEQKDGVLFREYFLSHPPLKLRMEKYTANAKVWWQLHKKARRYLGVKNLKNRITYYKKDYGKEEWVSYD